METAQTTTEEAIYSNINTTRFAKSSIAGYPTDTYTSPNDYVAKTNGSGNKIGPAIILKVMAGDQFNIRVSSWYKLNGATPGTPVNPLADLLTALTNGIGTIAGSKATTVELQANNTLNNPAQSFLNSQNSYTSTKPKAFLNWIVFDEQFNYVSSSSGFEQVGADQEFKIHQFNGLAVNKNGYLYIYTSNETPNIDVFFDNLQVTHIRGPVLEETHYYPFGLTMAGISSKAVAFGGAQNRKKYNDGTELNSDFDVNLYETKFRSFDPQLGRFWQIDRFAPLSRSLSPYLYASNNPILRNDPLGLKDSIVNGEHVLSNVTHEEIRITYTPIPKGFWAKQRLYYEIMDILKPKNATISQIAQPSLRRMMYIFDDITRHRERVAEMTYASDLYIWGTFLAPIVIVEGTFFIVGGEIISLAELEEAILTLRTELKDLPFQLYRVANTKYNDLVKAVLGLMASKQMELKDFVKYIVEMNKNRDLMQDTKAIKEVYEFLDKIMKLH